MSHIPLRPLVTIGFHPSSNLFFRDVEVVPEFNLDKSGMQDEDWRYKQIVVHVTYEKTVFLSYILPF